MLLSWTLVLAAPPVDPQVLIQQRLDIQVQRTRDERALLNRQISLEGLAVWEDHKWRSPLSKEVPGRDSQIRILHLWSVDCPPCRTEMPRLLRMDRQLQTDYQRQVRLVLVSQSIDVEDMKRFEQFGIQLTGEQRGDTSRKVMHSIMAALPQHIEPASRTEKPGFGREPPLPMTLVLDRDNVVRVAFVGSLEGRHGELVSAVDQLFQVERDRELVATEPKTKHTLAKRKGPSLH